MEPRAPIALALLSLTACTGVGELELGRTGWSVLDVGTTASLRGLCVVSADVVWASGTDGTVLRSADGGAHFDVIRVDAAGGADLRSIHAFDAERALVATAGTPARVLRTTDGGRSWRTVFEDPDPRAFFDSLRFDADGFGVLFGDPTGPAATYVRISHDGGLEFRAPSNTPAPVPGEAGFAASGTCIVLRGPSVWIATGGTVTRVLRSDDRGATFEPVAVPVRHGEASQGVFSIAFADRWRGVAVGGDYAVPGASEACAAFTRDGGHTWLASEHPPGGYRSGAAFAGAFGADCFVAVGTNGADASHDGGRSWSRWRGAPGLAFNAIAFANGSGVGFAVGPDGRVAKVAPL